MGCDLSRSGFILLLDYHSSESERSGFNSRILLSEVFDQINAGESGALPVWLHSALQACVLSEGCESRRSLWLPTTSYLGTTAAAMIDYRV